MVSPARSGGNMILLIPGMQGSSASASHSAPPGDFTLTFQNDVAVSDTQANVLPGKYNQPLMANRYHLADT